MRLGEPLRGCEDLTMKQDNLIGREATIKTGWMKGEWGIIKYFDGDLYHIAMWNGDSCMVFERSEFKVSRKEGRKAE